jgi:exoribonuclease R
MQRRSKKESPKSANKKILRSKILDVFNKNTAQPLNYKQVSAKLGLSDAEQKKLISEVLDELLRSGQLNRSGAWKVPIESARRTYNRNGSDDPFRCCLYHNR